MHVFHTCYCCFILAIPVDVLWYLPMVLICTYPMNNNGGHIFMGLLIICRSFSEECFVHLKIGLLFYS